MSKYKEIDRTETTIDETEESYQLRLKLEKQGRPLSIKFSIIMALIMSLLVTPCVADITANIVEDSICLLMALIMIPIVGKLIGKDIKVSKGKTRVLFTEEIYNSKLAKINWLSSKLGEAVRELVIAEISMLTIAIFLRTSAYAQYGLLISCVIMGLYFISRVKTVVCFGDTLDSEIAKIKLENNKSSYNN